jgi:FkbM family methyltransferase
MGVASVLRRLARVLGYSVHRWPASRFEAMDDALVLLRGAGYRPGIIVDGGANMGEWARTARRVFPDARLHLIEPQAACRPALEAMARDLGGLTVHAVAVTRPGVTRAPFAGGGGGTGARIARGDEAAGDGGAWAATTLDALLADRVGEGERALLKLDLEGHEAAALEGAERLLRVVEVVIAEVQFFEVNGNGLPVFADVAGALARRGFDLYDFAGLAARPRDRRLRMGDAVFVRRDSILLADRSWS